jgi:hypothetical protein
VRGVVSRNVAASLVVALSPDHSGITNLCPWSPIATGIYLDRTKRKNKNTFPDDWQR